MSGAGFPTRKGWTQATLERLGVTRGDDGRWFITTAAGWLRYDDTTTDPTKKMRAEPGSKRVLWPLPEDQPGDVAGIVEGEPDVISFTELALDMPVMAVRGVGKAGDDWPQRIAAGRQEVFLFVDADSVGRTRMRRLAEQISALGVVAYVIDLAPERDDGYDVGDLLVDVGYERAREVITRLMFNADPYVSTEPAPERRKTLTLEQRARIAPNQLVTVTASTVTPRATRWFWGGWIPLGMVSLIAGLPGLGKTTFALHVAADATRGDLEGAFGGRPVDVLVVSLEDVIDSRLVPLLMAANADLERVHFIGCKDANRVFDLTRHMQEVDRLAEHHRARLLFIDPLVAAMPAGEVSSHRDQDVRSVLAPLHALAERHELAAVATMHFSKSAVDALLGVGGSIAFTGLARSLLIFGVDPTDDRGEEGPARILAHRKCNVGVRQRSRQCWIQPATVDTDDGRKIETSFALLGDECDVSADDLVRVRDRTEPPIVHATRFLRHLLADGPHAVQEIQDLAEDEGIAWRTVERAKRDLGVESFQKDRKWWWQITPPEEQLLFEEEDEDE